MAIHIVRLGAPRVTNEGVRLGTVRRPPRGVAKSEIARRDFYDVWLPELAPSEQLLSWARAEPLTEPRWKQFVRRYQREMNRPESKHLLATLAALSHHTNFAVGCYCEDANRCHRSLLAKLLEASGAIVNQEVKPNPQMTQMTQMLARGSEVNSLEDQGDQGVIHRKVRKIRKSR